MKKINQILNKLKKAFTLSKEIDSSDKSNWSIADWLVYIIGIIGAAVLGIMQGGC